MLSVRFGARRLAAIAIGVVLVVVGAWTSLDTFGEPNIRTIARDIDRDLPLVIDSETVLEHVRGEDNRLVYHFRLQSMRAEVVDTAAFERSMRRHLIRSACTPQNDERFFSEGIALEYVYQDMSDRPVASITVSRTDCGGEEERVSR